MIKAAITMLCTLGALASFCVSAESVPMTADIAAQDIKTMAKEVGGSKQSLNEKVIKPFSSGGTISTYDGKQQVKTSMTCEGSNKFLKLLVQPERNGDLKIIQVQQDTNTDGSIDSYSTPNWQASMICANGFMSCSNAADISTCKSYVWSASDKNVLGAKSTGFGDMGGCYCVSGACGSNLVWKNMQHIMNTVGSGMTAALAKNNPFYTMSKIEVNGTEATVYGSDKKQCQASSVSELVNDAGLNVTNLTKSPNELKNKGKEAVKTSKTFNLIQSGSLNPNENETVMSCSVKRQPTLRDMKINEIITYSAGYGDIQPCGKGCIQLALGKIANNNLSGHCKMFEFFSRFYVKKPDRIQSAVIESAYFDDYIQVFVNNEYLWSAPVFWNDPVARPNGKCELSKSWKVSPNVDFTRQMQHEGDIDFKFRVEVTGNGEGYMFAKIKADLTCGEGDDYIADTCEALQNDADCKLMEEDVDGVKTFYNGAITGLSPTEQVRTVNGESSCSVQVKRPWFEKTRKYRCKRSSAYDLTKELERSRYVRNHVDEDKDKYGDKRWVGNGTKESTSDIKLPYTSETSSCVNVCKTRKVREMPDVGIKGTNKINKNPVQYDIFYNECDEKNQCPMGEGQELVKSCQCVNDFAEATGIMQVMRMAGQDMICSSGTKKSPSDMIGK
ncbi:hypothetical protein [Vibrio harveyi]|uniref:hypothetical protein n=1 Tax=Vibrio harveyi TaxID=669 RepID=UPI003BB708B9